MKRLPLMSILAGVIILLFAAASAEAQCFDCVQEAGSNLNRPNLYCTGGNDFSACTTVSNIDPNTCETFTTCNNTYACTTDPGNGDYCSNSSCDSNQRWDIQAMQDMYDWYCYHYTTYCGLWR